MLPILERLLYKPKETPVTRVLILVPTRELAVQVHTVASQLAKYTNIQITLSAGRYFLIFCFTIVNKFIRQLHLTMSDNRGLDKFCFIRSV